MLKIENVSKSYQQGDTVIPVITNVYLDLHQGDIIAIMGKSGSGKSTLLSLLSGILKSSTGDIHFDGLNYNQLDENKLSEVRAKKIGFIFQNFHLVSYLNALENIMLPAQVCQIENAREKAMKLLEQVGLKHRADHLPSELSGGEKQRIAIARALIHQPKLILADEPSGSLDEQTGEEIMDLLFNLVKENKTSLILVTHAPNVAKRCQKTYQLFEGKLNLHET